MKVREAMHKGAEWREVSTPLVELAKAMVDQDIGSIPIGENDRLVGMVTDRDITCRAVAQGLDVNNLSARDVMTENILYCKEDDEMDTVIDKMERGKIRRMPVINGDKRLVGMLSLGDISQVASQNKSGEFASSVSAHH